MKRNFVLIALFLLTANCSTLGSGSILPDEHKPKLVKDTDPERLLAGSYIYNKLGGVLNNNDYYVINNGVNNSLEHLENNVSKRYSNNNSGMDAFIEPVRTYQNDYNEYCREYKIAISVGQAEANSLETACRISDSKWQIIN